MGGAGIDRRGHWGLPRVRRWQDAGSDVRAGAAYTPEGSIDGATVVCKCWVRHKHTRKNLSGSFKLGIVGRLLKVAADCW